MRKNILLRVLCTIILGGILYYLWLPPLNLSSMSFWFFLFILLMIFMFTSILKLWDFHRGLITFQVTSKKGAILPIVVIGIVALIGVINLFNTPFLNAKGYAKRIHIDENGDFAKDIGEVNFNALPLLDEDSSRKLGDRVMGQMPELVSQFKVSDLYTQINYKSDIVRVTPLEYASMIKYFTNRKEGVKGYITVNSVTGDSKLIKLKKGMKYMPSALFNENLYRKLRFSYPTEIFGEANFELDEEGNPYWIVPLMKYSGVGMKREVIGIIALDPITGQSKKYKVKDVPKWVDHVYNADLLIEQMDDWGLYKNGFFNSIFGQKNVVMTTTGYNYTVMNDDVYLYTGITSAAADEATIGFVMSNLRTKETKFYAVPGATEESARASAEGQVQQMKYNSTFPLLINLNGNPTYLVSLKDNAGLVKMYGFVDVKDYQKVVVTDASKGIETAAKNYLGDADLQSDSKDLKARKIEIKKITTVNMDGNTWYYFIDENDKKYKVSIKVDKNKLPFVKEGDFLEIEYREEKDVTQIENIK